MKKKPLIKINFRQIFREVNHYIAANPMFVLCVCVVNMVYMLLLKVIPEGVQNPLFIVWILTYYVFWCFFYRYYYRLEPYFLNKAIFGSLTPSTKALFLLALCGFGVALLPMVPLFLGFDDVYMDIHYIIIHTLLNPYIVKIFHIKMELILTNRIILRIK